MIQRAIQAAWLLGVVFTVAVAPLAARDLRPGIRSSPGRHDENAPGGGWPSQRRALRPPDKQRRYADRARSRRHGGAPRDLSTGKTLALGSIHFLIGVFGSRWKEYAQPRGVILPKSRVQRAFLLPRRPPKGRRLAWFADDGAMLVLEKPLSAPPLDIEEADAPSPGALTHAAYAGDRRHQLTAHMGCALQGISADGL